MLIFNTLTWFCKKSSMGFLIFKQKSDFHFKLLEETATSILLLIRMDLWVDSCTTRQGYASGYVCRRGDGGLAGKLACARSYTLL